MNQITPQLNNIKEIESGKYRNAYLIYNRKSTDEPENQKNSIHYQKNENIRFAYKEKLTIAQVSIEGFCLNGIVSEKHSAFKEKKDLIMKSDGFVQYRIHRPKFYKLAQLLSKNYFKGVIVLCWDRISRNKTDESVIKKLMKCGIDFRFVLATYDKTSSGALHMDIDSMFAEHHSRVTSEKVRLNIKNQKEKGFCTYQAPIGYLNIGKIEEKPIDPEKAPIVKKMFELYATGKWSLSDLAKWAISQGFTMRPRRRNKNLEEKQMEEENDIVIDVPKVTRLPTPAKIHLILKNPFYSGKIKDSDGKYVFSNSHQALVSEDIFSQVQRLLKKKNVSVSYTNKLNYPMRGMIRCHQCHRVYTPYEQKGSIYYGARCVKECSNKNKSLSISNLTLVLEELISGLILTESESKEVMEKSTSKEVQYFEEKKAREQASRERVVKKLNEDLAYLEANKLTLLKSGVFTPEGIINQEASLKDQLEKMELAPLSVPVTEVLENTIKLSELLNRLNLYYQNGNYHERETILRLIFSELEIYQNTIIYKCRNGLQIFRDRLIQSCARHDWLSELPYHSDSIEESIQEVESFINKTCIDNK